MASFAAAAAAYATVEIWFAEILRYAVSAETFVPTTRSFTIAVVLVYFVSAVALAYLMTTSHRIQTTSVDPSTLASCLLLAFIVANGAMHFHASLVPAALTATALAYVIVRVHRSSNVDPRLAFLQSPWTVSLVMLGPDWVANDCYVSQSYAIRSLSYIAALVTIALVCAVTFIGVAGMARVRVSLAFVAVVVSIGAAVGMVAPSRPDMPPLAAVHLPNAANVVLITMDTVRSDHMSLYGYDRDTTPELRRFAANATTYTHAVAPSNMTLATHASLFTGVYASVHGAHYRGFADAGDSLPRDIRTLGEIFRARGYDVSSVAANTIYLGTAFGLDRGFSYLYCELPARPNASLDTPTSRKTQWLRYSVWHLLVYVLPQFARCDDRNPADRITDVAISRVDHARNEAKPFFLFLNYFDAHAPYRPSPPYDRRFLASDASRNAQLIADYDGAIASIDAQIGRFVRSLSARGLLNSTIVVITSDHGEAFGDHETFGHGSSTYEEQVHVPLIVRAGHEQRAVVVSRPVSLVDVFAFLTSGATIGGTPVVAEAFPLSSFRRGIRIGHAGRAIVSAGLKLIRNVNGNDDELYDITSDPHETHNLVATDPAKHIALSAVLTRWIAAHPVRTSVTPAVMSNEMKQRLRSLGYLR